MSLFNEINEDAKIEESILDTMALIEQFYNENTVLVEMDGAEPALQWTGSDPTSGYKKNPALAGRGQETGVGMQQRRAGAKRAVSGDAVMIHQKDGSPIVGLLKLNGDVAQIYVPKLKKVIGSLRIRDLGEPKPYEKVSRHRTLKALGHDTEGVEDGPIKMFVYNPDQNKSLKDRMN